MLRKTRTLITDITLVPDLSAKPKKGRGRHQPVAPNAFPRGNSHMPAMNCARPPQNMAIPTTAFGSTMLRAPALNSDKINVVDAKEKSPLDETVKVSWLRAKKKKCHGNTYRVAGLAIFEEPGEWEM